MGQIFKMVGDDMRDTICFLDLAMNADKLGATVRTSTMCGTIYLMHMNVGRSSGNGHITPQLLRLWLLARHYFHL